MCVGQVGDGDYVITAGEQSREMFIIIRGEMEILADNNSTVLAVLGPGSYFGEMAVVSENHRHIASVRASSYCELYSLSKEDLQEAFTQYPEGGKL